MLARRQLAAHLKSVAHAGRSAHCTMLLPSGSSRVTVVGDVNSNIPLMGKLMEPTLISTDVAPGGVMLIRGPCGQSGLVVQVSTPKPPIDAGKDTWAFPLGGKLLAQFDTSSLHDCSQEMERNKHEKARGRGVLLSMTGIDKPRRHNAHLTRH